MITSGDVKAPIASTHGGFKSDSIRNVSFHSFKIRALQPARIAAGPHQCFDLVPARDQFVNKIRADKTRSASDKAFHKSGSILPIDFQRADKNFLGLNA